MLSQLQLRFLNLLVALLVLGVIAQTVSAQSPVLKTEFIFENAPFPQCHASTVAEATDEGKPVLLAAWFGGTHEKHKDVGVWLARKVDGRWAKPVEVVNGVQDADLRYPCWNPVLFVRDNVVQLYYKVGPSPREWWGMLTESKDAGRTWSRPVRLPKDILGPIKNKPVQLSDGRLLAGSSTEHKGWRVHLEWSADKGKTWSRTKSLRDPQELGAIQPTILSLGGDKLSILCRRLRGTRVMQASSNDLGKTWTPLKPAALPNPNSGIDGVTLEDGRHLLVYNHTKRGRSPLNVAISNDGKKWQAGIRLENIKGEFSYPAIIQTADKLVHITYTYKRRLVKHVVVDPRMLKGKEFVNGEWPTE